MERNEDMNRKAIILLSLACLMTLGVGIKAQRTERAGIVADLIGRTEAYSTSFPSGVNKYSFELSALEEEVPVPKYPQVFIPPSYADDTHRLELIPTVPSEDYQLQLLMPTE